ncbi:tetratricopeptide repeat protein [Sedimentitalea nanhaiensis]|uniref:Tetratricopeptide repeat-containing protein n=1 Tax=Sedimentitalea nanhaiensis TaxID=999627 RepID=A0A1I7AXJ4_9RHOB|nr:Tetratricopeptide repeat-containing protein [Sedimentitalea nanhaiensis]
MASPRATPHATTRNVILATALAGAMAGCAPDPGADLTQGPYAPGVDHKKTAIDGLDVGNRLMSAGEYELALDAFTRAALDQGMTPEVLTGLGTANLGLGRLGQSERQLRRAVADAPDWPEAWNNLGVVLMEQGKLGEAQQIFRKAYALDNGQSDSIRDNLRLALAKTENSANTAGQNEDYKLVRRSGSEYLIRKIP